MRPIGGPIGPAQRQPIHGALCVRSHLSGQLSYPAETTTRTTGTRMLDRVPGADCSTSVTCGVRVYENGDLADYLAEHKGHVFEVIGGITGFVAYHLITTGRERCRSASATTRTRSPSRMRQEAAAWLSDNPPDFALSPPALSTRGKSSSTASPLRAPPDRSASRAGVASRRRPVRHPRRPAPPFANRPAPALVQPYFPHPWSRLK